MVRDTIEMNTSTRNPEAQGALAQGVDRFNRWRADAFDHIDAAVKAAPDFVLAQAVKGLFLHGGRSNGFAPAINECLTQIARALDGATREERAYAGALEALASGEVSQALLTLEMHLSEHPTDLFVHRIVQQELFWMGEVRWMRDIAERAAPAWRSDTPGYGTFLSVRAFGHEETGTLDTAERLARAAVERDPTDCWGAHARAHVLEMRGDSLEGIRWLEGLSPNWAGLNQISHHVWWHLCLFLLERGEHARALDLLAEQVRNIDSPLVQAAPDAYIDIQNVASLLVRLELRGVDVGARWESVAEAAAGRIGNHASPFTSAHAAMILAATGRDEALGRLLDLMDECARTNEGLLGIRMRSAALPAALAAVAHRRGEYRKVVDLLMPARRDLWRMGGSHAQRDVFTQLLLDACRRLALRSEIEIVLAEAATAGFARVHQRTGYAMANELLHNAAE